MHANLAESCCDLFAYAGLREQCRLSRSCSTLRRWYNSQSVVSVHLRQTHMCKIYFPLAIVSLYIYATKWPMTYASGVFLLGMTPRMQLQRIEFHLEDLSAHCLMAWCRVIENKIGVLQSIYQNNGHIHMKVSNLNFASSAQFELLERFPWMALPLHGMFNQYPNLIMVINAKNINRDTIIGFLRHRYGDVPSVNRNRSRLEELMEAAVAPASKNLHVHNQ